MRTYDNNLIDKYLNSLQNNVLRELYRNKVKQDYLSGLTELEIAYELNMKGMIIVPDPKVDNRRADIKTKIHARDVFIEATVIKEVSKDVKREFPTCYKHVVLFDIPTWEEPKKREVGVKYLLDKIVNKIIEEIYQLPENNPNLLFINVEDPFVSMHDVEDVILGFPSLVVYSETMETRVQREEFKPFRTLEDLTIVLKRISAFIVYEEGNLKEANIYFNDNNAAFPLDDKEKQLVKDFVRNFP